MTVLLSRCVWPGAGSEYVLYAVVLLCCGARPKLAGLRCSDGRVQVNLPRNYFSVAETSEASPRRANRASVCVCVRVCVELMELV